MLSATFYLFVDLLPEKEECSILDCENEGDVTIYIDRYDHTPVASEGNESVIRLCHDHCRINPIIDIFLDDLKERELEG